MLKAMDCTPWNMTERPTTPGTSTVRERGLLRRPMPADALADLREDEEKHEAQKERLDQGADYKLAEVLLQHN